MLLNNLNLFNFRLCFMPCIKSNLSFNFSRTKIDNTTHVILKQNYFHSSCNEIKSLKIISSRYFLFCNKRIVLNLTNFSSYSKLNDITQISISLIKQSLESKHIDYLDGFTCLILKCPFCNKKNDLFINKVTGIVICAGCKRSGKWNEFENLLLKENNNITSNKNTLKKISNEGYVKWNEICINTKKFSSLTDSEKLNVLEKLKLKESQDDLFNYLNVHVDANISNLYLPLKFPIGNEIVGYKKFILNSANNNCNEPSPNENIIDCSTEFTEPFHGCGGVLLYKSKSAKKDHAVFVHSLIDFISLAQFNLSYHLICLPHGLTYLPQEILPVLERYKKIVLWFGNDTNSWDGARQFAKKLNEDRCYFVRPIENNPPAHIIASKENSIKEIKRIIENAECIKHPSIINFSSIRQHVFSELHNIDKAQGIKWKRFPGLNNLLKGFRRGELSIFTGPTGSGKTTFLSEYSLDLLTQGVSTLWGSFEVKNQRLACVMLQQYVQLPLGLYPEKLNCWADSFERFPLHFMTFHGQQPLKVVLEVVEHASYIYDTAHVIIDNVQFMLGMVDNETNLDRFYRQDSLIAAFRNFATKSNCHVTLVIHPRKERDAEQLTINSVFGGAKASQEADNVLIIQQKMLQSLKIKKYLQVAKNRYTGDLGLIPLDFDKETLSFSVNSERRQQKKDKNDKKDSDFTENISDVEDLHILQ